MISLVTEFQNSTPEGAIKAVFQSFSKHLRLFIPGNCESIPMDMRRVLGALAMHVFRRSAHYSNTVFGDTNTGELLGKAMWRLGCAPFNAGEHVPAVVRGACYAATRFLAEELGVPLATPDIVHLAAVSSRRATAAEQSLVSFLLAPTLRGVIGTSERSTLHSDVIRQLRVAPAYTLVLPFVVSDALEEVFWMPNLDSASSREFAAVWLSLTAGNSQLIPTRFLDRLVRVELAPFEDCLRHLPCLIAYLSERCGVDNAISQTLGARGCNPVPSVCIFLRDLMAVLPSVSPKDYVAFCELAVRSPSCLSAVVSGNFSDTDIVSKPFIAWLLRESPYKKELDELDTPGDRRSQLLYWPSGLLRTFDVCAILKIQLAERGWSAYAQDSVEIAFRRKAFEALSTVFRDYEAADASLHDFIADPVDLDHFSESFVENALLVKPDSTPERPEEKGVCCDEFVEAFLGHDSSVGKLYTQVQESRVTLSDVETVLVTFLDRIAAVRNEIGSLREQSSRRATMLENSSAVEKVVSEVVTHLVVPPDVVHIISNAETCIELGPQFRHALKILHGILQDRCGGAHHATSDHHSNESSLASSLTGRAVKIVLPETLAFRELIGVPEDLVVLACSRIKVAFDEKLAVLKKPRTNIAVQQEHILGPLHPFVRLIRIVIPLLRRSAAFWKHHQPTELQSNIHPAPPAPNFHFSVVKKIYGEMRQSYIDVMRLTYSQNISRYLMQLKQLEDGNASTQGWMPFSSREAAFTLPPLVEHGTKMTPGDFGMGRRQKILENLLAHPVVPVVASSRGQKLLYEETFRSVNVMLCDVVTREYLFVFDFFGADDTIYAEIFRPVVQYIVDYVAEMLLQVSALVETDLVRRDRTLSHSRFGKVKFSCSNTDVVGLLTLIRMCHVFRMHMRCVRRLECLDGFYDSLLEILWPAFKRALGIQIDCMRSVSAPGVMKFLSQFRSSTERLAAVHPVTLRYAEFTAAVITLAIPMKLSVDPGQALSFLPATADGADSDDYLVALRANLSILRIEFMRIVGTVVSELVREGSPLVRALSAATLVNNLYHVVTIWSLTPPLIVTIESTGVVAGKIESCERVEKSPDYVALDEQLNVARAQFVEQLLRLVFPWLVALTHGTCNTLDIVDGAKTFSSTWQESFAVAHRHVQTVLAHPKNQQETLPQFCMQLLLYNTRSHTYLAQAMDPTALKSVIVTNHQIIQFVSTFAHINIAPVE